jgi:hypothetical protein
VGVLTSSIEHCAFLVRFHVGLTVDPLAISVPIIDLPLVSPDDCRDIVMGHKICLVVHSNMPPCPAIVSEPKAMSLGSGTPTEPSPSAAAKSANTATPAVNAGKVKVLIEHRGTLGHRKCLISGFAQIAERVVAGILSGGESNMRATDGTIGKGPLWNVSPW